MAQRKVTASGVEVERHSLEFVKDAWDRAKELKKAYGASYPWMVVSAAVLAAKPDDPEIAKHIESWSVGRKGMRGVDPEKVDALQRLSQLDPETLRKLAEQTAGE